VQSFCPKAADVAASSKNKKKRNNKQPAEQTVGKTNKWKQKYKQLAME